MRSTPRPLSLTTLTASLASAHAGDVSFSDDFWWWTGAGDFFEPANWNEGENAFAPLAVRPASIGPAPVFLDGAPAGYRVPDGASTLSLNFLTTALRLVDGPNTELVIRDAFFTVSDSEIGAPAPDDLGIPEENRSTLVLDNARWSGPLRFGSGDATLILRGEPTISGLLQFGGGRTTIANEGVFSLATFFDGAAGTFDLVNTAGSTLTLLPATRLANPDGDDRLTNEANATIVKGAGAAVVLEWPITNDGRLEVPSASLELSGTATLEGAGTIATLPNGRLILRNALLGDTVRVDIAPVSSIELRESSGPASLTVDGSGNISAFAYDHDIIIEGFIRPNFRIEGDVCSGTWFVAPGGTLNLSGAGRFIAPEGDDDRVVIEPGGRVRASDTSSMGLFWPIENNGRIEIVRNSTSIGGAVYAGNGVVEVYEEGTFFCGPSIQSETMDIRGREGSRILLATSGAGIVELSGSHQLLAGGIQTDVHNLGDAMVLTAYDGEVCSGTLVNRNGASLGFETTTPFTNPVGDNDRIENLVGGEIRKDAGPDVSIEWALTNEGVITVELGSLALTGPFTQSGSVILEGGTLALDAPALAVFEPGSDISGIGTIALGAAGLFDNNGVLHPGTSNAPAASESLLIDAARVLNGGPAVLRPLIGTSTQTVVCTGIFEPGGILDLRVSPGFEPTGSESIPIVTAAIPPERFFANATPKPGSDTVTNLCSGGVCFDLTYAPDAVIVSNLRRFTPCNAADLAEPGATLDLADINRFVSAFTTGDPDADLAEPFGILDLADITTFIAAFTAGCP